MVTPLTIVSLHQNNTLINFVCRKNKGFTSSNYDGCHPSPFDNVNLFSVLFFKEKSKKAQV